MVRPAALSADPAAVSGSGRKQRAFLLAVCQTEDAPPQVYAVKAHSEQAAMASLAAEIGLPWRMEIAGRLGRDLARKLKLKPSVPRLIYDAHSGDDAGDVVTDEANDRGL